MEYAISSADCAAVDLGPYAKPFYLGYREADRAKPFASFFQERVLPIQPQAAEALNGAPLPSNYGLQLSSAADAMSRPGYLPGESGYTVNDDGLLVVSCLTHMPGVTGEMWDWWFGWHGTDTSRYKLWHPDSHQFTAMGENRDRDRSLSDRQRYINNVSYIGEFLGMTSERLAIRFFDPERFGFAPSKPGSTVVVARVGASDVPVAFGWLVHQIRATEDGSEMRSRFFLNAIDSLKLPARAMTSGAGRVLTKPVIRPVFGAIAKRFVRADPRVSGPDLLHHCAQEMNHLASFLAPLHTEFKDLP